MQKRGGQWLCCYSVNLSTRLDRPPSGQKLARLALNLRAPASGVGANARLAMPDPPCASVLGLNLGQPPLPAHRTVFVLEHPHHPIFALCVAACRRCAATAYTSAVMWLPGVLVTVSSESFIAAFQNHAELGC